MLTDKEEIILPKCNGFIRRLVYKSVAERLGSKVSLLTRELPNNDRVLVVTRPKSIEEKKEIEEEKCRNEEVEFENAVGFSKIVRLIVDSVSYFLFFLLVLLNSNIFFMF